MALLEANGISVVFGEHRAVDGVSVAVDALVEHDIELGS